MPQTNEPVIVATFANAMEADIACAKLDAEGIEAALVDDQMALAEPLLVNAFGGVRIMVRREDAESAVQILNFREEPASRDETKSLFACPKCGSTEIRKGGPWALVSVVLLCLPIFPTKKRFHCKSCDHAWRE